MFCFFQIHNMEPLSCGKKIQRDIVMLSKCPTNVLGYVSRMLKMNLGLVEHRWETFSAKEVMCDCTIHPQTP